MNIIKRLVWQKRLNKDRILFYAWPLAAGAISLVMRANFFTSLFLFFGLPTLFLSYRNKEKLKKALLFSLSALIIVVVLDYICDITGIWLVTDSIIEYRLLGQVTIENIIWFPLWTLFIIMYYEYFFELTDRDVLYKPRLKYLYLIFSSLLAIFLVIYLINKDWLYIQYFYLKFGLVLVVLPILLTLFNYPRLFIKLIKTGIYFFYLSLTYEITALHLNQWIFPGQGIVGRVFIGPIFFPLEELFFWMVLGAIGILSYYEFFDDDDK